MKFGKRWAKFEESSEFPSPCGVNIVANFRLSPQIQAKQIYRVSVPLRGKYRGEYRHSERYVLCSFQGSIFTVHLTFVYKRTRKQIGN